MPVTRGIVVDWAYSAGYQCERSLAYTHTGVATQQISAYLQGKRPGRNRKFLLIFDAWVKPVGAC